MMRGASTGAWMRAVLAAVMTIILAPQALAAGVPAGTPIENTATVNFEISGNAVSVDTNTTTVVVAERIDLVVTRQSPQLLVQPGDTNQAILFRVTNTGNGTETFSLAIDSNVAGSDFNPVPAVPPIYFDTDGSGDFNTGDVAYDSGVNDPELAADASIDVFLVNNIPGTGPVNGERGLTELTATSLTGTGAPGTSFPGQGDGGGDAVLGTSGGTAAETGEYLVADVEVTVNKSQVISDPFGGSEPVPGATITYTITVEVASAGTAANAFVRDPIPQYTTYSPGTIQLDGGALTDAVDTDAGELDTSGSPPAVVVRLGDLEQADGTRTVEFQVTID